LERPPAQGMGIMDHPLPMPTRRLHTLTPLRHMGIGIIITDRGTTLTGTVVIMDPDIMDIGTKGILYWVDAAANCIILHTECSQ